MVKYSRHSSYVECNDISTRSLRSFDNLLFKFNVSLPLVPRELLQKMVDVNNVKYKLYNIESILMYLKKKYFYGSLYIFMFYSLYVTLLTSTVFCRWNS